MTGDRPPGTTTSAPRAADSHGRVRDFLDAHGLADRVMDFEPGATKTSQMAADAAGCLLGQIAKSLVFVADGTPVLALVAGDRKGDAGAIAREVGASTASFADAVTVRDATGYAIGGVSPFDLPEDLIVLIDESLVRFDEVYTAGGTPQTIVRMERTRLFDIVGGRVARISR
jgi:prolyl-tRNA editing enzyme YbaK/EbsC (Cys-tRNA(Pro) deacylase)